MKKFKTILFLTLGFSFLNWQSAAAESPHSFMNKDQSNQSNFSEQVYGMSESINSLAPTISFVFTAIFSIMFLWGVVRMAYSLITKTGSIMKGSTGLLIWVPIVLLIIRVGSIIMFTSHDSESLLIASDFVELLKNIGYYSAAGMILIGLYMFLFNTFLNHPEYLRWGKRLCGFAIVLFVLAAIMPYIISGI